MNQNNSPSRKLENNSVLFVSDLPRDANEEDVYLFFKNYHCTQVKINKYCLKNDKIMKLNITKKISYFLETSIIHLHMFILKIVSMVR